VSVGEDRVTGTAVTRSLLVVLHAEQLAGVVTREHVNSPPQSSMHSSPSEHDVFVHIDNDSAYVTTQVVKIVDFAMKKLEAIQRWLAICHV